MYKRQTEDGFAINRYFIDHPEMVLGRQESVSTAHGMDYTVNPIEGLEKCIRDSLSGHQGN